MSVKSWPISAITLLFLVWNQLGCQSMSADRNDSGTSSGSSSCTDHSSCNCEEIVAELRAATAQYATFVGSSCIAPEAGESAASCSCHIDPSGAGVSIGRRPGTCQIFSPRSDCLYSTSEFPGCLAGSVDGGACGQECGLLAARIRDDSVATHDVTFYRAACVHTQCRCAGRSDAGCFLVGEYGLHSCSDLDAMLDDGGS